MLPPLPAAGLQVVSIDSLEAALAKMDIEASVEDIHLTNDSDDHHCHS
jgi:hypothetical protein